MTQGSIGRRLTLLLAAGAAALSVLSWSMVTTLARQGAERTQDNILAASVTTIAETLRVEQGEVRLELPYSAFSMLGAISEDRVFYRVTAGGEVLTGYGDLPAVEAGREVGFATGVYRGDAIRMASLRRSVVAGGAALPVTVSVAQTRDGVAALATDLSWQAAVLSVAFFVVAVAMAALAARASLRPLNEAAAAVARRGPTDLRPLRRPAPSELAPLMASLNTLMERLGQSIRRSEDFIAEAAHRIRTPLATVRTQAEIALRSTSDEADRERLRRIIRAVDESSRSAGQLLDHATVAYRADDLSRDPVDLAELARRSVAALEPTAEMKDIALALDLHPAWAQGDAVLLESALRNVLDNAIKYSPDETQVRITLRARADVRIEICDQGPGFGVGAPERLTERFERGADTGGIVGSGLGLTIARDTLLAHGGRLELCNTDSGRGACVSLVLPLG